MNVTAPVKKFTKSGLLSAIIAVVCLILFFPFLTSAQTVNGTVIDSETGEPLPSANVYLSNTTYGTGSSADGSFELSNLDPGQYQIVIRFIGYEEIVRPVEVLPSTNIELGSIKLKPDPLKLDELEITSKRSSDWDRNLEFFTEIFIGSSDNADNTEILNPEVLDFETDQYRRTLKASADAPIHIINRSLGYELLISLRSFNWDIREDTGEFYFTSRFDELPAIQYPELSEEWHENRKNTYEGSFRHFLDLVLTGNHEQEFDLTNGTLEPLYPEKEEDLISFANNSYHTYKLDTRRGNRPLRVRYERRHRSQIETRDNNLVLIDSYGNLRNPENIITSGYWSTSRIADLLPVNYPSSRGRQMSFTDDSTGKKVDTDKFTTKTTDASIKEHLDTAVELIESGNHEVKISSFALARTYLIISAVENRKELFENAIRNYLRTLKEGNFDAGDKEALRLEIVALEPINSDDDVETLQELINNQPREVAGRLAKFCLGLDPTPTLVTNERLIEHHKRVHEARQRYPYTKNDLGTDDRGRIFIKYGEPDFTFEKPFNITRADIFDFVSEYQFMVDNIEETTESTVLSRSQTGGSTVSLSDGSERSSQSQAYVIVDEIERILEYIPYGNSLNFWIYTDVVDDTRDNLIFYFREEEDGVFKEIPTLEGWITPSLFLPRSTIMSGSFAPALALQYITYERLKYYDRQIMQRYNRMQSTIFDNSVRRSDAHLKQLSSQIRDRHEINTLKRHAAAPVEKSTEIGKIDNIPMNVFQYRMMDKNERPVWVTFLESKPIPAFLNDLTHNQDFMINDSWDDDRINKEISKWYELEAGVELFESDMEVRGRISGTPPLIFDERNDGTATQMVLSIPASQQQFVQKFYAYLKNSHPESVPRHSSLYPVQFRGMGSKTIRQDKHFERFGNEMVMSDLILGHTRLEDDSGSRFPFVISHNRVLPADHNLIVHFEVYRLQINIRGIAEFEVDYDIEKESRTLRWLRKKHDAMSGTLNFTTDSNRFSESLEIENLPLDPGNYTLTFTVHDMNGGESAEQKLEFEVVDEELIFSDRGVE